MQTNVQLYILDPKNTDLADLGMVMDNVYHIKEDMIECVNAFYEGMVQRSEEMKHHPDYKMGENYAYRGILDIPDLTAKCNREECVFLFRSFKSYASGESVKHNEQDKAGMGHTLYIGSLKSEVYFCCYEKNYEQYAKLRIPIEEAPIKNRFEIRLKDERAYYAVRELLTHYDAEQTAFSIINHYIRFVDREPEKRKTDWKLNDRWAWFIGKDRPPIKLTTDPEPYTLERTLGWISRQVAPTLKMLKKIDAGNSTSYLKEIEDNAKLTEKHLQIIKQQTADTEELITE